MNGLSRREAIASAIGVFLVALAVRIWAAAQVPFPAPEDTAYYVSVAQNLLDGRGLVSDAIWSYATPPLVFPRPAFEVWLPLPTFLAALPMALLDRSFAAAQWSSMVVGALVPVLGWRLAADVAVDRGLPLGRARTLALGTGLTAAVYLPLLLHSALPDSTMPFAALALTACLLMTRAAGSGGSVHLIVLGLVLGLTALARNEAALLALTWVVLVMRSGVSRREQLRQIGVVAMVSLLVFAPWAIRDWIAFGSPFPGQALLNTLSLDGHDIFAWQAPPTLATYLAAGPSVWFGTRVTGIVHNLLNVLLLLGVPISLIGLAWLPWAVHARSLQPLALAGGLIFAVDSLLFPVSTTWGTFLHAAGPVHVLLLVSCLLALDAVIARVAGWRGWTRPVAWLGATLGISAGLLFSVVLLPTFGGDARATQAKYAYLAEVLPALAGSGQTPGDASSEAATSAAQIGPVITDFPIWLAAAGLPSLALPNEPPSSVADLAARFPGTRLLVVDAGPGGGLWPGILDEGADPAAACFHRLDLPPAADPFTSAAVAETRVYRIACP